MAPDCYVQNGKLGGHRHGERGNAPTRQSRRQAGGSAPLEPQSTAGGSAPLKRAGGCALPQGACAGAPPQTPAYIINLLPRIFLSPRHLRTLLICPKTRAGGRRRGEK